MRKLIFFLLFPIISFAQKDTINNATITVGNTTYSNVTIIIPKQSNSGVNKFYVDSGLAKKQDKLIQGNNISISPNNVISATNSGGGISLPYVYPQPEQTWAFTYQSPSYGTTYSNGTRMGRWFLGGYKTNPVVGGIRPDPVFTTAAYNILFPNGVKEFPTEAAWEFGTIETDYPNPGYVPPGDFEGHIFRTYTTDGQEHRHHSVYVNKTTGAAREDFEASEMTFNLTQGVGKSPYQYMFFNEGNIQTFSRGGRVSGFQATQLGVLTGLWNIGGTGFLKVPNVIDADGYGKFIAALPVFSDNAAAKAAGKPINQWYKDPNGFVRIVQ